MRVLPPGSARGGRATPSPTHARRQTGRFAPLRFRVGHGTTSCGTTVSHALRRYIVDPPPPPQARTRHGHEAHAVRAQNHRATRGCRPRPRRSHAGHGTTGSICSVPPHGAPGRVHQTPPAPLGARLSARREARGLRTTARPVAPTRARGALVSVSLARLGHEKVSSNVRHVRGRSRKSRNLESGTVQKFRILQAVSIPSPKSLFSSLGDLSKPPVFF